jgi:lipoate---protein ligase
MCDLPIRLLDLGQVPYLRSQTLYHAVAYALRADSPDTILLLRPQERYACIGYHQDLDQEIDLGFCRRHGLPVLRREVGGGTVYLDSNQLFYHLVFHQRRAPRRADELYRTLLAGPIAAYRRLGVAAELGGLNDIVVDGRKIGGTGAGSIGEAVVLCGSLILDIDPLVMARLIRTPSSVFASRLYRRMRHHVTSLRRELGQAPPLAQVRDLLVQGFAGTLGRSLVPGELRPDEWAEVERLDRLFAGPEWLQRTHRPTSEARIVKVRAGMWVCEAQAEAEGQTLRLTTAVEDGCLARPYAAGEPGLPKQQITHLRSRLHGACLDPVAWRAHLALAELAPEQAALVDACLIKIQRTLAPQLGREGATDGHR